MKVRIVGDIHADFGRYIPLLYDVEHVVQVGDYGAGFDRLPSFRSSCRFIRGNHDNLAICKESANWIPDGTIEITDLGNKIFYMGGAYSVDRAFRRPGIDWWPDEELSLLELQRMINLFVEEKPDVVITHDCPSIVAESMFGVEMTKRSRTQTALSSMFDKHQPNSWYFGHYHQTESLVVDGTNFSCLGILEYVDVDL